MAERRQPEKTYVWQAEKPLRIGRYEAVVKGQPFTPSRRMVTAFGDLMLSESKAKEQAQDAEEEATFQAEKAERQAARAEKAAAAGTLDERDLAPEVQAHRMAEREGTTSHSAAAREEAQAQPKRAPAQETPAQPKRPTKE